MQFVERNLDYSSAYPAVSATFAVIIRSLCHNSNFSLLLLLLLYKYFVTFPDFFSFSRDCVTDFEWKMWLVCPWWTRLHSEIGLEPERTKTAEMLGPDWPSAPCWAARSGLRRATSTEPSWTLSETSPPVTKTFLASPTTTTRWAGSPSRIASGSAALEPPGPPPCRSQPLTSPPEASSPAASPLGLRCTPPIRRSRRRPSKNLLGRRRTPSPSRPSKSIT